MINRYIDKTEMIFGTGDIGMNSGVLEDDNTIGIVIFYNQDQREIGLPGDIKAGTEVNIDDFPVVIKFHKTESIDVLIEVLLEAKDMMLKGEVAIDVR